MEWTLSFLTLASFSLVSASGVLVQEMGSPVPEQAAGKEES